MSTKFRSRDYHPGAIYHLTVRGHRRRPIFLDSADRNFFIAAVSTRFYGVPKAHRPELLAYAFMRNHAHLLPKLAPQPFDLARSMKSVRAKYAHYFNDKYGKTGPVWESPYRSKLVLPGPQLLNTIAYIHLNPAPADRDTHSSHGIYTGRRTDGRIAATTGLAAFGGLPQYRSFIAANDTLREARDQ